MPRLEGDFLFCWTAMVGSLLVNAIAPTPHQALRNSDAGLTSPAYYYSKLGDLKIGLLAKASADGRKRAETIAEHGGNSLGRLNKATMGVFQITGQNMDEDYSFGGVFNTTSINKTATITVKMEYMIE